MQTLRLINKKLQIKFFLDKNDQFLSNSNHLLSQRTRIHNSLIHIQWLEIPIVLVKTDQNKLNEECVFLIKEAPVYLSFAKYKFWKAFPFSRLEMIALTNLLLSMEASSQND